MIKIKNECKQIMPAYSKGQIYCIGFFDNDKNIYIGSTIQLLAKRFEQHKIDSNSSLYQLIQESYNENFKCCYIAL